MFGRRSRDEAATVIPFPTATQDMFEGFADDVSALIDGAVVLLQSSPIMGRPYAIIHVPGDFEGYRLIVDEGQALCKNGDEIWVAD